MTVLGKILVGINLLFSLLICGFIVVVYTARTNWKEQYDKAVRELKVSRADRDTYRDKAAQVDDVTKKWTDDKVRLTEEKAAIAKDSDRQVTELKDQIKKAQQDGRVADDNFKKASQDAEARLEEVKRLQTTVQEREKNILALESQSNHLRTEKVNAEIQLRSSEDRNQNLLAQIQDMMREREKGRVTSIPGGSQAVSNPPAEDLEGLVKATDTQTGYVTVTLGSDHNLAVGNTLEVFRLKPEAKWIGTIKIVAVTHHEAVGRPVTPIRNGTIKQGDMVASKIQPGR